MTDQGHVDTQVKQPSPVPEALRPAVDLFEDAHQHWHDAAGAYHAPSEFRRHVEALVQASRNVTWRVQAAKAELPERFDEWYAPWQALMKADPQLAWLKDARLDIVHKKGLETASACVVRVIESYLPPEAVLLTLPPDTGTADVLRKAVRQIPEEWRPYVAIEVTRRWEVPSLPGSELLSVFAHCLHVLDALLLYVRELAAHPVPEDPAAFLATVLSPPCMRVDPSFVPLTFEADTGNLIRISGEHRQPDVTPEESAKRYRVRPEELPQRGDDLVETAVAFHEMARRIYKKDGNHIPMVTLFGPGDDSEAHVLLARDKREKFMMWHEIGHRVAHLGYESFVFTTEIWKAKLSGVPMPIPNDFEGVEGRLEALHTFYEHLDGTRGHLDSPIVRHLGRAFLKRATHEREADARSAEFALPVRAAWSRLPTAGDGTRASSSKPHATGLSEEEGRDSATR